MRQLKNKSNNYIFTNTKIQRPNTIQNTREIRDIITLRETQNLDLRISLRLSRWSAAVKVAREHHDNEHDDGRANESNINRR
jgi:hypothetical protein